jgi:hypothetical protein
MPKNFQCQYCEKPYQSRSGVYKHEKTCHKRPDKTLDSIKPDGKPQLIDVVLRLPG